MEIITSLKKASTQQQSTASVNTEESMELAYDAPPNAPPTTTDIPASSFPVLSDIRCDGSHISSTEAPPITQPTFEHSASTTFCSPGDSLLVEEAQGDASSECDGALMNTPLTQEKNVQPPPESLTLPIAPPPPPPPPVAPPPPPLSDPLTMSRPGPQYQPTVELKPLFWKKFQYSSVDLCGRNIVWSNASESGGSQCLGDGGSRAGEREMGGGGAGGRRAGERDGGGGLVVAGPEREMGGGGAGGRRAGERDGGGGWW